MKTIRTVLFWVHLACGVTAGAVILIMSATGVVLALRPQVQNWIDRDVRLIAPRDTPRLTAQQLLDAVRRANPDAAPQALTVSRDPALAAAVGLGPEAPVYVDPYSGAVRGSGSAKAAQFFQALTNWHRWLAMSGESRATGRSITGISNVAFLALAISGLYLWWPRQLTVQYLKPIVWFRGASSARAREFNWHNTIGFWCLIPILAMTASGVVMSYAWANDLVYKLTGSPVPVRAAGPAGERGRGGRDGERTRAAVELDRLWARAEDQVPTWSVLTMRVGREGAPVAFTITDGANWNAFARSTLTLSRSGDVVQWQPYERNSLGQKVRGWLRFAHTGELGGLPGQLIAGLACLGGVFLVYTGISLAVRRLWNFMR